MKSKKIISILISIALIFSFTPSLALAQATDGPPAAQEGQGLAWPRVFEAEGVTFSVYQPQIEKWNGATMSGRLAVMVEAGGKQTFGVAWLEASANVDKEDRIVVLRDFKITQVKFPTTPEKESEYAAILTKHLPQQSKEISLDHFETSLAVSESVAKQIAVEVKNDPPRILYSDRPAILILVDGQPVMKPIEGMNAERVINTHSLIVRMGGSFYLRALGYWYQAGTVEGPWGEAIDPPPALDDIRANLTNAKLVDTLEPKEGTAPVSPVPAVFVSTSPAELLQTDGVAKFLPIEGTGLLQIENADHSIFMNPADNDYYLLVSGRWFKASSFEGPWTFVAGKDLPADFAKIPSDSAKASVLVSVPGTPQAKEAVIANSIPQTAAVKRAGQELNVKYDGQPQFRSIQETKLEYAFNAVTPVIRVSENSYYAVEGGVWFTASSPIGPWAVADQVPGVIYTIPPSSPLYYVTYVRVYGSTPDVVYVGYTPGYLGAVVSPENVVVYGTGYTYPPYVENVYIGYPQSYGYDAGFEDGEATGFGFGFATGMFFGACFSPWWGPYGWWGGHNNVNININNQNIYNHWDHNKVQNAKNKWNEHHTPVAQKVQNRTGGEKTANRINEGKQANVRPSDHARANDVYASRDGHVYQYRGDGTGWAKNTAQGWQNADRDRDFQNTRSSFDSERFARDRGNERFDNFSRGGDFSRGGGFSGGGFSRGGGGRRR